MTFEGIIYKITGSCGNVYIGSTTNFNKRKACHNCKYKSNKCYSKCLKLPYQFEIIRKDKYKLIKTMYLVEQYYIDTYKCVNKNRAYSNSFIKKKRIKEYDRLRYINQTDKIKLQNKKNYEKNKNTDKFKKRVAKNNSNPLRYEKHNCPCGGKYTNAGKYIHINTQKHKKYMLLNNII